MFMLVRSWSTMCSILALCLIVSGSGLLSLGCSSSDSGGGPLQKIIPGINFVPEGNAGYVGNLIVAPNATIIYHGVEHAGSVTIPHAGLVGIMKDGKAYLYHPRLGNAPLSDYNSRRAVGYFVSTPPSPASLSSMGIEGSPLFRAGTITPGESKELETGIQVLRHDSQNAAITNGIYRWAAVKTSTGMGPFFLPPAPVMFDSNLLRILNNVLGVESSYFATSDTTLSLEFGRGTLETYGAVWRLLPTIAFYATDALNAVSSVLTGAPIWDEPTVEGDKLRYAKDPVLSRQLDQLDLGLQIMEFLKSHIATVDVTECSEAVWSTALNAAKAIHSNWAMGRDWLDPDNPVAQDYWKDLLQGFSNDMVACGSTVIPFVNCVTVPIQTFLDILHQLSFMVENVFIGDLQVIGLYSAYDEIEFGSDFTFPMTFEGSIRREIDVETVWGDAHCTKDGTVRLYFNTNGTVRGATNIYEEVYHPAGFPPSCSLTLSNEYWYQIPITMLGFRHDSAGAFSMWREDMNGRFDAEEASFSDSLVIPRGTCDLYRETTYLTAQRVEE